MSNKQSRKSLVYLSSLLWLILSSFSIAETLHHDFYPRLSIWVHQSQSEQTDSLETYIERHPDYQPAYLKLEERYLYFEQPKKVVKYFDHFSQQSPNYQNAQWMLGRYYTKMDQPAQALAHFENSFQDETTPYTILLDYQEYAFHSGHSSRAEQFLKTISLSERQNTILKAQLFMLQGRNQQAMKLFQSLLPLDDFVLDRQYYRCTYYFGDYEKARDIADDGQRRAEQIGYFDYEELFYMCSIKCRYFMDFSEDVSSDLQALYNKLMRCDNRYLLAQFDAFQGYVARRKSNKELAIQYYQEALEQYKKFGDREIITQLYQEIATCYYNLDLSVKALQTLEKSINFAKAISNYELSAWSWLLYSKIYRESNLYNLSQKYLENAWNAAQHTDNTVTKNEIIHAMQELQARQVVPSKAVPIYIEWLESVRQAKYNANEYYPTFSLAELYDQLGDYEKAREYYTRALKIARKEIKDSDRVWARAALAAIELKHGHTTQGLLELQNIHTKTDSLNDFRLTSYVNRQLGEFYKSQNELDKAIQYYQQTIDLSEIGRHQMSASELAIGYFAERQWAYQGLSECYYEKYKIQNDAQYLNALYQCEELMHARALKDEIQSSVPGVVISDDELEKYRQLDREYQALQHQLRRQRQNISQSDLDSLIAQIQMYKYNMVSEKIRLGNLDSTRSTEKSDFQLADVQAKLIDQTAVLYHITNQVSYALVVQQDTSAIVPLPISTDKMDSLINEIMEPLHLINENDPLQVPFHAKIAHILYKELFQPLEKACQLAPTILIIPSGSIAHMPFDILLTDQPSRDSYTATEPPDYAPYFLGQHYEFYYSPSTHLLFRPSRKFSPGLLIVADPFHGTGENENTSFTLRLRTGWRFDALPYAHLEASAIKKLAKKSKVLKEGDATEARVKSLSPHYGILHIASHAFVDSTFDIFSGLALADDKNDDGLLLGYEITDAEFPCNLVTLSACETGRGKLISGEGVLGLPRQFLLAGSRSVIMTKWKVDDEFTASFMPKFYKHFLQDGYSKASALTLAKREILEDVDTDAEYHYQHPFFWAAFNLYGDAGTENEALGLNGSDSRVLLLLFASLVVVSTGVILFFIMCRKKKAVSIR